MPPFVPRKRLHSSSPEPGPSNSKTAAQDGRGKVHGKGKGKGKLTPTPSRKPTFFDDLDAGVKSKLNAEQRKAALENLSRLDDEDSSLSSISSSEAEFEDIPALKRQKTANADASSSDDDEDIEFEDVETFVAPPLTSAPPPSGDLELTLTKETRISLTNPLGTKKGPSKIERQIRVATHQFHVQMLMWHNAIRNSWLCDKELQEILVKQLPKSFWEREMETWKRRSGLTKIEGEVELQNEEGRGKPNKGKGKAKEKGRSAQRDWGGSAERLASGQVDMSHGDPILRLLKYLKEYWRMRFRITAPGLRKLGYMSLQRLDEETKSFNKEKHDPERHGECIQDIKEFRERANLLQGSRDVGAQLFTALLRGLGLEARMVASLQPVGFGWNKYEEAAERKKKQREDRDNEDESISSEESSSEVDKLSKRAPKTSKGKTRPGPKNISKTQKPQRRKPQGRGRQESPIDLSESEELSIDDEDEEEIAAPRVQTRPPPTKIYDKDLAFPHYWTEVLSPVTNTYIPVDPLVLNIIVNTANNDTNLEKFEPRGQKAENAKQVIAYVVGFSHDGTAKDVTTRYLKRHMWPGRTKGVRIPVEKIPVYNHHGKVKRYEEFDWFKTVMSGYVRGTRKCPRTEVDDHEDLTDLKPMQPERKEVKEGEETLQWYKSSAEFVLERHLRREEAILPTAKHVKMFTVKTKGGATTEEKVFLRKDVVACKSIETWHKEGRAPLPGEEPRKRVPYRAATTNRRRELAEAEHATGEKVLQGLYSRDQTDWIIPPPIKDGIIPKNEYGNIDVYVPSMVPEGAVHIPRRGTVRICKKMGIDYAEAVTGFEFGSRMAVPIITGVVVAQEHLTAVMDQWEKDEIERARKEDEKRTKAALAMWRKMLMGLRIVERVRGEYGDATEDQVDAINPWTNKNTHRGPGKENDNKWKAMQGEDTDMAGGFFPEGHDEEEVDQGHLSSSFFPVVNDNDDDDDGSGGGFVVEGHDDDSTKPITKQANTTPQSAELSSANILGDTQKGSDEFLTSTLATTSKLRKTAMEVQIRGRNKLPASKSTTIKMIAADKAIAKRRRRIPDTDEEDEEQSSSLSDLTTRESGSEMEAENWQTEGRQQKPIITEQPTTNSRRTPKRAAARKSETALKSHYFRHSSDDEMNDV
ncbi:Rad4 transglutaminase-like domain-containing protein [Xylogone sp. PMI_703]|nr:Rad4 transglutaminase-like domain-containing protein [Xylogone sp. PMI_703]